MKKILPFIIIASSILTTVPVVTACNKQTEDTEFKPVFAYWNYTQQGKYVYPIEPLPEQTVESKEALTDIYMNESYKNADIVANDILQTYALGAESYIEDETLLRANIDVNVYEIDLKHQTISYEVNIFTLIKPLYVEDDPEAFIGMFNVVKIPCAILPKEEENQIQYDLTVKTLDPNFWSKNRDWELEMFNGTDTSNPYQYFNYENCLGELDENALDPSFETLLVQIFGASNIQYLKNITITEN